MKKPTLTFVYEADRWSYNFEAELDASQAVSLIAAVAEFLAKFAEELQDMIEGHNHQDEA